MPGDLPETMRPSEVFAHRLREVRTARGMSQAKLARLMTDAGRPLSKVALLRIENGRRGLSLDEALTLAELLNVAPAHLLSPPDGAYAMLTDGHGISGNEMRIWLLFGGELGAPLQRVRLRVPFVLAIEVYAQAILDARNGGDEEGRQHATRALEALILDHNAKIGEIEEES